MLSLKYNLLPSKRNRDDILSNITVQQPSRYSLISPSESGDSTIPSVSQHVDTNTNQGSASESTSLKRLSQAEETDSEDSSSAEGDVLIRNRCTRCRRSGLCSFTIYVWLAVFMLGCFAAMMVIGVVIVGPFHRVSGFHETTCFSSGFQYTPEIHQCSCGKGCKSAYRCLLVTVTVTAVKKGGQVNYTAQVFENEIYLDREVSFIWIIEFRMILHENRIHQDIQNGMSMSRDHQWNYCLVIN